MAIHTLKTRVVSKHAEDSVWANATDFIPLNGEIIIYSTSNKMKVGDGVHNVVELPFITPNNATLTIGNYTYDGTAAVTIPTYGGSEE